jgi:hypothetical protein
MESLSSLDHVRCPLTEKLRHAYVNFQQTAKLPKRLALKASPPLLVFPHDRWRSSSVKVLVIGQETLRWQYHPDEVGDVGTPISNFYEFQQSDNGIAAMWNLYRWYALGRAFPNLNSPFWRGFRALNGAITGCEDSALWTNVFKVNVDGSVMRNCKAAEIQALCRVQRGLLREEIAVLKPDIVVFFSGPKYDSTLRCEFPDVEFSQFTPRQPKRSVALIQADGLPSRTLRTYHPEYLQRSNQLGLLSEISRWATGKLHHK